MSSYLKLDLDDLLTPQMKSQHRSIMLSKNGVELFSPGAHSLDGFIRQVHFIEALGLEVHYFIDPAPLAAENSQFFLTVFGSITLGLGAAVSVLLLLGRLAILIPYKRLLVSERNLQTSEERYEMAVNGASVGLWDWNVQLNELYWSPIFKEMVGVTDSDFVPEIREFEDRLHPDDHDRIMSLLGNHMEYGTPYDAEYRLRRNDGAYIWIHAKGKATRGENGQVIRVAGSVSNISERKEVELRISRYTEQLENSNAWLDSVIA